MRYLAPFVLFTTLAGAAIAQEGQNFQVENVESAKKADIYTQYAVDYEDGTYKFPGLDYDVNGPVELHRDANGIVQGMKMGENTYCPDHEGYTVTWRRAETSINTHEDVMWCSVSTRASFSERLVFLDNYVFRLVNYKSAEDFVVDAVYVPGETKGFKKMFAVYGAAGKMKKLDPAGTVRAYLMEMTAKQAELKPAWDAEHADMYARREWASTAYRKEAQAMADTVLRASFAAQGQDWTLRNNTGNDLEISLSGSTQSSQILEAGKTLKMQCGHSVTWHRGDEEVWYPMNGKDHCGKTVNFTTLH